MNKPVTPSTRPVSSTLSEPKRKPRKRSPKKPINTIPPQNFRQKFLFMTIEVLALVTIAIYGIVVALGNAASWFSGTSFLGSLLPFAAGVMALILASTIFLLAWWKLRTFLKNHSAILIPIAAIGVILVLTLTSGQDRLSLSIDQFRALVGGKEEASRATLNHQVFAAYRRNNSTNLNKMMQRAEPYNAAIMEAATEFELDQNLLQGIAATESSFIPRDSHDGGHGLFQITAVPKSVLEEAKEHLKTDQLSLSDHRHNAFIAAATFKHYLAEMKNDVFLGLLAYNIGPANGGLRFIMKKYSVTDFITIQPYLQLLPRDYPIRVLSYALAFRLWQKQGKLLPYQEGSNAMQIQRLGVPGLP
jgi:Transglycosylase SLT domain